MRLKNFGSLILIVGLASAGYLNRISAEDVPPPAPSACGNLCRLAPLTMEGPYHAPTLVRQNISEDLVGVPLEINLILRHFNTCQPLENIVVDIWHSNVEGGYSGFAEDRNKTYCRGLQVSDSKGSVTFQTIYPGWYDGRAIHIHVEAISNGVLRHVGQLYFPQSLTLAVSRKNPYSMRWSRPIPHELDWLYRNQGGAQTIMDVKGTVDTGLYASLQVAIDPDHEILPDNRQYPRFAKT